MKAWSWIYENCSRFEKPNSSIRKLPFWVEKLCNQTCKLLLSIENFVLQLKNFMLKSKNFLFVWRIFLQKLDNFVLVSKKFVCEDENFVFCGDAGVSMGNICENRASTTLLSELMRRQM
jgi:hypothetical protein